MSASREKFEQWLLDDEPSIWPAGLRPDDQQALTRTGPAPRVDAAVLGRIAEISATRRNHRRPVFLAGAAAAIALVALGIGTFLTFERTALPVPAARIVAVVGEQATGTFTPGPLKNPGRLEVPRGVLLYLSFGPACALRLSPGRYVIQQEGPSRVRIETGALVLVSHAGAPDLVLSTPYGEYRREGTVARLSVSEQGDRLEVLEGRIAVKNADAQISVTEGHALGMPADSGIQLQTQALSASERESLAAARSSLQARGEHAQTQQSGPTVHESLEEIRATSGPVFRVTLKDGRVLEGHILAGGSRTMILTPQGTLEIPGDSISRLQALP